MMTNQEAVDILRHTDIDFEVDTDKYLEAFDMAVSALEHEYEIDHCMTEDELLKRIKKGKGLPPIRKETKQRNPALDVKPRELPTAYSPRHTIRDLFKS